VDVNRRRFLSLFATGTAAMALDPELALWKPSAKTIFLPPAKACGYTLAAPPEGLSIRMVRQFDAASEFPVRMDVLYGWATLRPELACVIRGDEPNHAEDAVRYAVAQHAAHEQRLKTGIALAAKDLADAIDRRALEMFREAMLTTPPGQRIRATLRVPQPWRIESVGLEPA
jgi:hypothetical protein